MTGLKAEAMNGLAGTTRTWCELSERFGVELEVGGCGAVWPANLLPLVGRGVVVDEGQVVKKFLSEYGGLRSAFQ